jgi:hypothetical protein
MREVTRDTGSPEPVRRGRPRKEETRDQRSLRLPPTMWREVEAMAKAQGRTLTGQFQFLVEHAARELGSKLYDMEPAPIQDLYDRLGKIEGELAQLRSDTTLVQAFEMLVQLSQAVTLLKAELAELRSMTVGWSSGHDRVVARAERADGLKVETRAAAKPKQGLAFPASVDELAAWFGGATRRTVLRRMSEAGIRGTGRGRMRTLTEEEYRRLLAWLQEHTPPLKPPNPARRPQEKARAA